MTRQLAREIEERARVNRDARKVKDASPPATIRVLDAKAMRGPFNPRGLTEDDFIAALNRANKLIEWMSGYIGNMCPMDYHQCYSDLNEHGLFMEQYGTREPKGSTKP